jgi:hypothetical protein
MSARAESTPRWLSGKINIGSYVDAKVYGQIDVVVEGCWIFAIDHTSPFKQSQAQ